MPMQDFKRWVIYVSAVFLIISASVGSSPNLYFMAALLLALPLISYLIGMFSLRGLEFKRTLPSTMWEGQTGNFEISVNSESRLPRLFLELDDLLPESLEYVGQETVHFDARPMTTSVTNYRVLALKRGAYRLSKFKISASDPLGIYSFTRTFDCDQELIVYPLPPSIPEFQLSGAERFGFRDMPINAVKGNGVDPDGVREYVPGDSLRRIHWSSFARTGKLNVIEFEESRSMNLAIAINLASGTNYGQGRQSTLEYLVHSAAGAAQSAVNQGSAFSLHGSTVTTPAQRQGRGPEHLYAALRDLAYAECDETYRFSEYLSEFAETLPRGASLVVLTAEVDDDLAAYLSQLQGFGTPVIVVIAERQTFEKSNLVELEASREFIKKLVSSGATVYTVSRTEDRHIELCLASQLVRSAQ